MPYIVGKMSANVPFIGGFGGHALVHLRGAGKSSGRYEG